MQGLTDEELIEVIQKYEGSRRKKAFDCLYLRYYTPITQYFYFALNKDFEKAKDFFHDLFLKLLESPDRFDTSRPFKPWIFRVAANMCRNDYRKSEVANRFNEYILKTTENYTVLNETEAKLAVSIKKLNSEQRSLIVLRFKINLTIKEMAGIFECPEGTVKSKLFYATKELSEHYKK